MDKKIISTEKAPKAIGPYSQAVVSGGFIFTSGQIPVDPNTGEVSGSDVAAQAEMSLTNLKAVLEEAGASMASIVKTTCFLADMSDFAAFNEVYARFIASDLPARSCVAVKGLPKGVLCEIEAIACL